MFLSACWWSFPFWHVCMLLICSYGSCLPALPCAHVSAVSLFFNCHTYPLCMLFVVHTYLALHLLTFQVFHVCLLLMFSCFSWLFIIVCFWCFLYASCCFLICSMCACFCLHILSSPPASHVVSVLSWLPYALLLYVSFCLCLVLTACESVMLLKYSCCLMLHISSVLLLFPFHTVLSVCCWCSCLSSLPFSYFFCLAAVCVGMCACVPAVDSHVCSCLHAAGASISVMSACWWLVPIVNVCLLLMLCMCLLPVCFCFVIHVLCAFCWLFIHILSGNLWVHHNLLVSLLQNCSYVSCPAAVVFSHVSCIPAVVVVPHVHAYLLLILSFYDLAACSWFYHMFHVCLLFIVFICMLSLFFRFVTHVLCAGCWFFIHILTCCCSSFLMVFMCACCWCVHTPPVSLQLSASCVSCLHAVACS